MPFHCKAFIVFYFLLNIAFGQSYTVSGIVTDANKNPLEFVSVGINGTKKGTVTNQQGKFILQIGIDDKYLTIKYLGYKEKVIELSDVRNENTLSIQLEVETRQIGQVEVKASLERREEAGLIQLNPKNAVVFPSPFGDFNKVLQSLPGVVSNNELSSTYAVRGGSYDENLIYVNGFEIYRPFLVRSGQQEGLSFVNPNLASEVSFSTGGWQSKYGDKLSSVMNVKYKEPQKFEGSAIISLLGGQGHIGGSDKDNRISFVSSYRNKSSKYLLNTLPTQGQYLPVFNDFQTYVNIDLTNRKKVFPIAKRTQLSLLGSYAGNRYSVIPATQETNFTTGTEFLKLLVAFEGAEQMNYDTWQGGVKLSHWYTEKLKTEFMASGIDSREREYVDLEAGYRLCDVDPDPASISYNTCAVERGVGTLYRYARNSLHTQIFALENRSYYYRSDKHTIEFGAKYYKETISDKLYEYSFADSLDYIKLDNPLVTDIGLSSNRFNGYVQSQHKLDSAHTITYGVRFGYWDKNQELLISPSVQYSFKPHWKRDVVFRFATGIYRQPPFYRELRNYQGVLNTSLKAQNSTQLLIGADYRFIAWRRPFRLTSEIYFKYLWNVVPYDIDNVRLRYYANNDAIAYAAGVDLRVNGEFIKGEESWFSLSIMQTKEKVEGSTQGWIRRPTDQRITLACFFQDHIPKIPAWKVYIGLVIGTGLPIGLPNEPNLRNIFNMPPYRRVDLGTNYVISYNDKRSTTKFFKSIMIGIECLNILGINNTLSYTWVTDYNNRPYAVPNTLSQQFWNTKLIALF